MQEMALKHSEPPHQLVDAFQPKAPRPGMSGAQTGCQPDASHHRDRGSTTQRTRTYTLTVVAQGCRRRPDVGDAPPVADGSGQCDRMYRTGWPSRVMAVINWSRPVATGATNAGCLI